jgi:hypothetical protein
VTALITGFHIPETSFSQLLAEIKERRGADQHHDTLQEGIVLVFIFFAERGIAKEDRDFCMLS